MYDSICLRVFLNLTNISPVVAKNESLNLKTKLIIFSRTSSMYNRIFVLRFQLSTRLNACSLLSVLFWNKLTPTATDDITVSIPVLYHPLTHRHTYTQIYTKAKNIVLKFKWKYKLNGKKITIGMLALTLANRCIETHIGSETRHAPTRTALTLSHTYMQTHYRVNSASSSDLYRSH